MSAEIRKVLFFSSEEVVTLNERYASADKLSQKLAAQGMCGIFFLMEVLMPNIPDCSVPSDLVRVQV